MVTFIAILASYGCAPKSGGKVYDTMTEGVLPIAVDLTFEPIVRREIEAFEYDFPKGHIKAKYKSEHEVVKSLLSDSVAFAVLSRKLDTNELKHFKKNNIEVFQNELAKDGIALILNRENKDSLFTMAEIKRVFNGTLSNWNQKMSSKSKGVINLVFDDINSSTARYMADVCGNKLTSKNVYALKTNQLVIDYVSAHREAIGIIGVNWISDSKDTASISFSKKITVAAIAPDRGDKGAGSYYKPYQAYIAEGVYPLSRRIFSVSAQGYKGLGTGFALFVNGDKGQRIFLKSGLVPIHGVVRIVEFK